MKRQLKKFNFLIMILVFWMLFCSCGKSTSTGNVTLWENAVYTENCELGTGAKIITVNVKAEEKDVSLTINTDKDTLGDALTEHNLIQGEQGAYGLYVKVVNGITADYDTDQSYWAVCKNGESLQTGVDGVKISNGEHYELIYTKN